MPTFALLFSLIWSVIVGAAAGMVAMIPAWLALSGAPAWHRRRWAGATSAFVAVTVLVSGYMLWSRWTPQAVSAAEIYGEVPGLRDREAEIVKAQDSAGADAATTYVRLQGPRRSAQRIAATYNLTGEAGDAISVRRWDNDAPQWWPNMPCPGGNAYEPGSAANPNRGAGGLTIEGALDADIALYDCPKTNSIFAVIQRRW